MAESTIKDERNVVKDDKTAVAYKEEPLKELIPELKSSSSAAASNSDEFPAEFARLMEQEVELDNGALRRLWQGVRAILPDASPGEIRLCFHQKACNVYRNRKLENPAGVMLTTIGDWSSCRRVLEQRDAVRVSAEYAAEIRRQIKDLSCGNCTEI